MEKGTLTDYLQRHATPMPDRASPRPWYNQCGDCIDFQTENVAVVADRIDHYLTIYRSVETNAAIGFQLKDVKALMEKYKSQFGVVWSTRGNKLISVMSLLLTAFQIEGQQTIKKLAGYEQAMKKFASQDEVSVA